MTVIELRPYMTKQEAAEYAGMSTKTMQRWAKTGRLKVVRPSPNVWRTRPEWIDKALRGSDDD